MISSRNHIITDFSTNHTRIKMNSLIPQMDYTPIVNKTIKYHNSMNQLFYTDIINYAIFINGTANKNINAIKF